jgi:hypothetical protein
MTRLDGARGRADGGWGPFAPRPLGRALLALAGALLLALAGCSHSGLTRAQSEDEGEKEAYDVKTVGDVTVVGNADPQPLGGVGLVVGLEGTGGDSPPDTFRALLVNELQKQGCRNIKEILKHPGHALVIVEAAIPPGANKGDPIDVEVKLPNGSRATSLRGGYLRKCLLYNYDFSKNLNPGYGGPNGMLLGHPIAFAEGPILAGVGRGADSEGNLKRGRIWGGGRSRVDQPFALMLTPNQQFARVASAVADRINETFNTSLRAPVDQKMAVARNNLAVALKVPHPYRHNLQRYLRVVRMVPLRADVVDAPKAEGEDKRPYRQRLAADLLDPARTVVAAIRLEALGSRSVPLLKQGLKSQHPLVRFCSAEALAYLGSPGCAEELGRAIATQPLFRAFGLAALASLDEAACHNQLHDLLQTARDDETRYGAFRALHRLLENNGPVRGELLNEAFWLHRVGTDGPGLVHISSSQRAEIVLFGQTPTLHPPFSLLAGELTITAGPEDVRCMVTRVPQGGAPARKTCGMDVESVLRAMADLGATYPEVVEMIQQANSTRALSCRARVDAVPQAVSVYELAKVGRGRGAEDLLPAGQQLGTTPTLYQSGPFTRTSQLRQREAMRRDSQPSPGQ